MKQQDILRVWPCLVFYSMYVENIMFTVECISKTISYFNTHITYIHMISGFHHKVDDNCALVGYYAASGGNLINYHHWLHNNQKGAVLIIYTSDRWVYGTSKYARPLPIQLRKSNKFLQNTVWITLIFFHWLHIPPYFHSTWHSSWN